MARVGPAAIGIAALPVWLCAVGCGVAPPPAPEESAAESGAPEGVATAVVRRGRLASALITSGSVVARRSTVLGPSVPGRILHVFVQAGDEVLKGSPVFQIDPGPYASIVEEAEAGLAIAKAELSDVREDERRLRTLASKELVSSEEHRRARTRVALAESRLEGARARLVRARDDLARTLVLAPYAGSIVERSAHEGTMATVTPNTAVVVLQESGVLEAVLDVAEASRVAVRRGDAVRLWTEDLADPIESRVHAVSRSIDPRSRTYRVRAAIPDPDGRLKAGAFVRAEIAPGPREEALLLDRSALVQTDGAAFAFRVAGGRAERVPLRLGLLGTREAEVLEGLREGDAVVVGDAVARLSDGARVRLLEVAARAAEPEEARR